MDEAAAIGWPECHLRLVPDPDPLDSVAHLRVLILNATDTFGESSAEVEELKALFDVAMAKVMEKKKAQSG